MTIADYYARLGEERVEIIVALARHDGRMDTLKDLIDAGFGAAELPQSQIDEPADAAVAPPDALLPTPVLTAEAAASAPSSNGTTAH